MNTYKSAIQIVLTRAGWINTRLSKSNQWGTKVLVPFVDYTPRNTKKYEAI